MQLRPYQQRTDAEIVAAWSRGQKRVLLQSATGSGKTVQFNHRAAVAASKGFRVLIVADRRELIEQAWKRLWQASGIHAGIIMAGQPTNYQLPVQIASIQTLNRRAMPPDIDVVIIDECRGSVAPSYECLFEAYPNAYFLGVDATPIRSSGQGFDHLYNHMVIGPTIKELEEMGSLVPAKWRIMPLDYRILDGVKKTAGDYNEQQLSMVMSDDNITADLVKMKLKHAHGLKTIVFAVDIEHSKMIIAQYQKAGITAVHVDGEMNLKDRAQIFKDYHAGKYEVLCNVGIACYGFDEPTIQCVQLARPTLSPALYLQMIGRGTRPYTFPDGSKKVEYILLDHANCIAEHGVPNRERHWTLKGKKKKEKVERMFQIKENGKVRIISGREFPQQMEGVELIEVEEIELRKWDFDRMYTTCKMNGQHKLVAFSKYKKKYPDITKEELQYIEQALEFKKGWSWYKWKEVEEERAVMAELR